MHSKYLESKRYRTFFALLAFISIPLLLPTSASAQINWSNYAVPAAYPVFTLVNDAVLNPNIIYDTAKPALNPKYDLYIEAAPRILYAGGPNIGEEPEGRYELDVYVNGLDYPSRRPLRCDEMIFSVNGTVSPLIQPANADKTLCWYTIYGIGKGSKFANPHWTINMSSTVPKSQFNIGTSNLWSIPNGVVREKPVVQPEVPVVVTPPPKPCPAGTFKLVKPMSEPSSPPPPGNIVKPLDEILYTQPEDCDWKMDKDRAGMMIFGETNDTTIRIPVGTVIEGKTAHIYPKAPILESINVYNHMVGDTKTDAEKEDEVINKIAKDKMLSFRAFVAPDHADIEVPMTNCVKLSGDGPLKIVFMRGDTWKAGTQEFINTANLILNEGFKKIDPFETYASQLSFYIDLKKVSQAGFTYDAGNGGIATYNSSALQELNTSSSCLKEISTSQRRYVFMFDDKKYNGAWNDSDKSKNTYAIFANVPKIGSEILPLAMLHEMLHILANLEDEYQVDKNQSVGNIDEKNCTTDPFDVFRSPLNGLVYGKALYKGCGYMTTTAGKAIYRGYDNTLLNHPSLPGGDKVGVVPCGYAIAAIKSESLDKATAAKYWPRCALMDGVEHEGLPLKAGPKISVDKKTANSKEMIIITGEGFTPQQNIVRFTSATSANGKKPDFYQVDDVESEGKTLKVIVPEKVLVGNYLIQAAAANSDLSEPIRIAVAEAKFEFKEAPAPAPKPKSFFSQALSFVQTITSTIVDAIIPKREAEPIIPASTTITPSTTVIPNQTNTTVTPGAQRPAVVNNGAPILNQIYPAGGTVGSIVLIYGTFTSSNNTIYVKVDGKTQTIRPSYQDTLVVQFALPVWLKDKGTVNFFVENGDLIMSEKSLPYVVTPTPAVTNTNTNVNTNTNTNTVLPLVTPLITAPVAPSLLSITPGSGYVGQNVTIYGTFTNSNNTVYTTVDNKLQTIPISFQNTTSIQFTIPNWLASKGVVNFSVENGNLLMTPTTLSFTVIPTPVTPTYTPNLHVDLTANGQDITSVTKGGTVTLNWNSTSATSCTTDFDSPQGLSGSVTLTMNEDKIFNISCTDGKTTTTDYARVYISAVSTPPSTTPAITSISPTSAYVGQTVTIYATNLTPTQNTIYIKTQNTTSSILPTFQDTTHVNFTLPVWAKGPTSLAVENANLDLSPYVTFTVIANEVSPALPSTGSYSTSDFFRFLGEWFNAIFGR